MIRGVAFFTLLISGMLLAQTGTPTPAGPLPRATPLPLSGQAQTSGGVQVQSGSVQVQGPFTGSTQQPEALRSETLDLSLEDAIRRGLQYNLGVVGANESSRQAQAQRLSALAQMLPDITGYVRESVQQTNLAALGLHFNIPIPGFSFPTIVGPYNYFDARASFSENVSLTSLRNWRSSQENARSAALSAKDSRDLVTLGVAGTYLQLLSAAARVDTARAQVETGKAVYQQAMDRNKSGLNARIDVNRSLVELQVQEQRVTSLVNDLEKQKISLARLIGLPLGQLFQLNSRIDYHQAPPYDLDDLIHHAVSDRADVQASAAQLRAAELAKKAATAESYPSVEFAADYGAVGVTPTNQAHGTFSAAGGVRFPIYRSGRIRADVDQAEAALEQRKAEDSDVKRRAEQEVRNAILDINAASRQVKVADSNRALAADTLQQARDRFRSGVSDTVEVVQAQESVASAEQDYITALFAFNLARVSLARAIGQTGEGVVRLLQGR